MAALDPIEQRLITGRWGLNDQPRTLAQLASQEAISVGEVKVMLQQAMGKMRGEAPLVPAPPPPPPPVATLPPSQPVDYCQLSLRLSILNP
jgi:hypothetical protein